MSRKMNIARPVARKSSGKNKPSKSAAARQSRKPEPAQSAAPEIPRRRFVEPPKVPGELPTPTATFYF